MVLCDVNEETLAGTASMLKNYNVAVSSHVLDVGDEEAIKALPEKVIAQHGKVDLVFNNAGITVDLGLRLHARDRLGQSHGCESARRHQHDPGIFTVSI